MSLRGLSAFGAFVGRSGPNTNEWVVLNPELMDTLNCTYIQSNVLRSVIGRLTTEVMRGGVGVRENIQRPFAPSSSTQAGGGTSTTLSRAEQSALQTMFNQAIIYGLLFGLVPITTIPEDQAPPGMATQGGGGAPAARGKLQEPLYPGRKAGAGAGGGPRRATTPSRAAFRIPPAESGRFLGRVDDKGNVQVGWMWRSDHMMGSNVAPAKDVFVFVWNRMPPSIGIPVHYNSIILTLLPDLMREIEMLESDMQATHELNHPPFVIQENPRNYRDGDDTHILELNMGNYVRNPAGGNPGQGPGGTLSADQVRMQKKDFGGDLRLNQSLREASLRVPPGETVRTRIDPCSGVPYIVGRTVAWQRGVYRVPAGWVPTTNVPRPTLRNDLANQRADVMNRVAMAVGVPPFFITGSGVGLGTSGSRSGAKGGHAAVGGSSASANQAQQTSAYEMLRATVSAFRDELSDLYGQAHFRLMWDREGMGMINQIAEAERMYEAEGVDAPIMARTLELLGETLAEQIRRQKHDQLLRTKAMERTVKIADRAQKLWTGEVIQMRVNSLLGIVAGVRTGTAGYPGGMSLEEVSDRQRRGGEGFEPRDRGLLLDPADRRGDLLTADEDYDEHGLKRRRKREQEAAIDPNELAEPKAARRERVEAEGPAARDSILVNVGPPDGSAGYQRRSLTEELPSFTEAMAKARELVDAREKAEERLRTERGKLRRVTGHRGDTAVELIWLSRPVPDWALMEQMAINDELDLDVYRRMKLSHFGFDPIRDAPQNKRPFQTVREMQEKPDPQKKAATAAAAKKKATPAKKKQKT